MSLDLVFTVFTVVLILAVIVVWIVYYISKYVIKWRPWGSYSDLPAQITHWNDKMKRCFDTFKKLEDLFSSDDSADKINTFFEVLRLKDSKDSKDSKDNKHHTHKSISSRIQTIRTKAESMEIDEDSENLDELAPFCFDQLKQIQSEFKDHVLERLVLKSALIRLLDNTGVRIQTIFSQTSTEPELVDLYTRYFVNDFVIDFSKSFCKYYDIVFYQLHHTESLNFNIKQSLRDINRKKQVKGDKDNVFEFLVSAFQGMIPFSKKVKTDIEELETEELKSYKAPTLSIELNNIDYLSNTYKLNLSNLSNEGTTPSDAKMKEIQHRILQRIFVEVAKSNQKVNLKILTEFLRIPKGQLKLELQPLTDHFAKSKGERDKDMCLTKENDGARAKSEEELIDELDIGSYALHAFKGDFKTNLIKFEKMMYSIESSFGPGLLSMWYGDLKQMYHTLIFLEDYFKNKQFIDRIVNIDDEDKEMYYDITMSLQEMNILVSKDFPLLQYYDMNREANAERKLVYYIDFFRRNGNDIETILEMLVYFYELYQNKVYTRHRKLRSNAINKYIDTIYGLRKKMHHISGDIVGFIVSNFNWALEGFEERYEHFLNEKKGPVIEHFGGLSKFFRTVGKFFKSVLAFLETILSIIQIITSPVKVLKLMIALVYSLVAICVSLVERYVFNIVTGTIMLVSIAIFTFYYAILLIMLNIFVLVFSLVDVYIFNLNGTSFLSKVMYWFTAHEDDIRNWYTVPGFEQGNDFSSTIVGHTRPCNAGYSKVLLYCTKNPSYLPHYSQESSIFKLYNNMALSGNLSMTEMKATPAFKKKTETQKRLEIYYSNWMRKSHYRTSEKFFNHHSNIKDMTNLICKNPDHFDLNTTQRTMLKEQCSQLFCQNGNYLSSCVSAEAKESEPNEEPLFNLGKIQVYLNSLFSIILVVYLIILLTSNHVKEP